MSRGGFDRFVFYQHLNLFVFALHSICLHLFLSLFLLRLIRLLFVWFFETPVCFKIRLYCYVLMVIKFIDSERLLAEENVVEHLIIIHAFFVLEPQLLLLLFKLLPLSLCSFLQLLLHPSQ